MTLAELGIVLRRHAIGEQRCPCPRCAEVKPRRGDDALAVRIVPDGAAAWLCHRCGWRGGTKGERLLSGPPRPSPAPPPAPSLEECQRSATRLWRIAQPITPSDVAGRYLSARGCALPHPSGDLRWVSSIRHPSGWKGPALVALVTDVVTGDPLTIHRTFLDPAQPGRKASIDRPRLLHKGLPKIGGIVRLWPDAEIFGGLAVAEGIETALALARGFGLAWSTIDKQNLAELPVLPAIEALTIAEDQDEAGRKATAACAERWAAASREVRIVGATCEGWDMADEAVA